MFSAKGRTNVELREQFTLPTGASQSMTAFKSKPRADRGESPTSSVSGDVRNGSQGPITKVSGVIPQAIENHLNAQDAFKDFQSFFVVEKFSLTHKNPTNLLVTVSINNSSLEGSLNLFSVLNLFELFSFV